LCVFLTQPRKKANNAKHSKTKLPAFYDAPPRNKVRLFYNAPEPIEGKENKQKQIKLNI